MKQTSATPGSPTRTAHIAHSYTALTNEYVGNAESRPAAPDDAASHHRQQFLLAIKSSASEIIDTGAPNLAPLGAAFSDRAWRGHHDDLVPGVGA